MKAGRRLLTGGLLALLAAAAATGTARSQEPVLLAEEEAGVVPVTGESRLLVHGLTGSFAVRAGGTDEMRFMSRTKEGGAGAPLRLWLVGGMFRLEPPAETPPGAREVEIVVPPEMFVELEVSESKVFASGLRGGIEVRGAKLEVDARGIEGGVRLEVVGGGRVTLESIGGDVRVNAQDVAGRLVRVDGEVALTSTGGRFELIEVGRAVEADLNGSELMVEGVKGLVRVRGTGGKIEARKLTEGGEFLLTGTPLVLRECKGDLDVETDAEVQFMDGEASVHVNGYGGASVKGSGNQGLVEIKTDGAEVHLEKIGGPTRVQGDGLRVSLKHMTGEVLVDGTSSEVSIVDARSPVTVLNEFGDVTVTNARQEVEVRSRQGQVRLLQQAGPVQVEAAGELVEVSWSGSTFSKDSLIRNDGGDVAVQLLPSSSVRVVAESRFGRIESNISGIQITNGGTFAQGDIGSGRGARSTIRIQSDQDISLMSGAGTPASKP